jgi:hypothetical protein
VTIRAGFFFVVTLAAAFLIPSLEAKEVIKKDKSPNGKFALELSRADDGQWVLAIVDLKSKGAVASLDTYQNMVEGARLVWSKDSQRVAYFEPDRRGGTTHIYFRNSSEFNEVEYPEADVPECSKNSDVQRDHLKTTNATTSPKEWLKSGALVVVVTEAWLTDDENERRCSETVTIAFDADHKASVQSVTDKKAH